MRTQTLERFGFAVGLAFVVGFLVGQIAAALVGG